MSDVLRRLSEVIEHRGRESPDGSWTARLLEGGPGRCAQKFGEEATEAVIAGVSGSREELASEAADALYHLLVLLASRGVSLEDVLAVLESREGMSGFEEKAGRGASGGD